MGKRITKVVVKRHAFLLDPEKVLNRFDFKIFKIELILSYHAYKVLTWDEIINIIKHYY